MVSWLRRNWWRIIWALLSVISVIFGSTIGFTTDVLQALRIQLTLSQGLALGLILIGVLGIVALFLSNRKGSTIDSKPFYRSDNLEARVEKRVYELGQTIFFEATFSGLLRAGFFEAVLISPKNETHFVWDPQTLLSTKHLQEGELHGEMKDRHARWGTWAQMATPTGEWAANIGIYDCGPVDWFTLARVRFWLNWLIRRIVKKEARFLAAPRRICVDERTVRFTVVERISAVQQWAQSLS